MEATRAEDSVVKNPPTMREVWFDPCWRKIPGGGAATHSSILALKNPMDRGTWQNSKGLQRESNMMEQCEATVNLSRAEGYFVYTQGIGLMGTKTYVCI